MTSAKSSVNPFRFTLARTMRKNFHFPAIIGVIIFVFSACMGIFGQLSQFPNLAREGDTIREYFKGTIYILGADDMASELFIAFMMLLAMAAAISIFRYMMSKKSVNVYYSLGITRQRMFLANYFAGVILLVLSVLIPMLVTLVTNLVIFGSSSELWKAWMFYVLAVSLALIFAFTVAAAVCSRVGTVIEAVIYSGVMLVLPVIIAYVADFLFKYFVYGAPTHVNNWIYTWNSVEFYSSYGTSYYHYQHFPLTYDTVPFANIFNFISWAAISNTNLLKLDFVSLIPLAVLTAVVCAVALHTYKKRKTEIAGFLGADELTKGISVFAVASVISAFIIDELIFFETDVALFSAILTVVIFAAAYLFFEIITVHNIKGIFKGLWKFAVHMAVIAVCIAIFAFGLFGYSSRTPDAQDVESAAIATGTGDLYLNYNELGDQKANSSFTAEYELLTAFMNSGVVDGFTSQEDIQSILEIHEKFIECKNLKVNDETLNAGYGERVLPVKINIIYTLKNGKTFERLYPVATDEIMQMLAALTETERYKEMVIERLKQPITGEVVYEGELYYPENIATEPKNDNFIHNETVEVESYYVVAPFAFRSSRVALASPALSSVTHIPDLAGNTGLKNELVDAICKDIENDTLPLNFNSDEEILGYIVFGDFVSDADRRDEDFEIEDYDIRRQGGTLVNNASAEPQQLNAFGGEFLLCAYDRVPIPVYADMSNTLKVLEDNGLTVYFSESSKPVKIRVWKPDEQAIAEEETYMGASMLWSGWWYNTDEDDFLIPANAISVTDAAEIARYISKCSLLQLSCYELYFAEIIFEDGGKSFAAIPAVSVK